LAPRGLLAIILTLLAASLTACNRNGRDADLPPVLVDPATLRYDLWAARHNAGVAELRQVWANAVVRLRWTDADGRQRSEQGEGRLQIQQPDRVALNIGKVGETFVWIGCDPQRYWWIDLTGDQRVAFAGRHGLYQQSRARSYGVVVPPLELTGLLGIRELPQSGGAIQASNDGRLVGLTTSIDRRGTRQRTWLDAASGRCVQVELFNPRGEPDIVASLEDYDTVALTGRGETAQMAKRVRIAHAASGSLITLDLSDLQDGVRRMSPDAFSLPALLNQMNVGLLYDLDLPARVPNSGVDSGAGASGAGASGGASVGGAADGRSVGGAP